MCVCANSQVTQMLAARLGNLAVLECLLTKFNNPNMQFPGSDPGAGRIALFYAHKYNKVVYR